MRLDFIEQPQEGEGTFHLGKEIYQNSFIDLEKQYRARDLLNIIRARTFAPFPAAYFTEAGDKYEVRIEIKKVEKEFDSKNINYDEIQEEGLE